MKLTDEEQKTLRIVSELGRRDDLLPGLQLVRKDKRGHLAFLFDVLPPINEKETTNETKKKKNRPTSGSARESAE